MILGYWPIRGLAQPIRLLLEYLAADYQERHYVTGPAPGFDKSDWLGERDRLGLDFPNLPYLIDEDLRLTESTAILRYLDDKYGLAADDPKQRATEDMVAGVCSELALSYIDVCYNPAFERARASYVAQLPRRLGYLDRFLTPRKWIGRPSSVDFLVYEIVDQHRALASDVVERFSALRDFCTRVEQLDRIAAYMRSPTFIRYPINNRMARFGGQP